MHFSQSFFTFLRPPLYNPTASLFLLYIVSSFNLQLPETKKISITSFLLLILQGMLQTAVTEEYELITDVPNITENTSSVFENSISEETSTAIEDVRLSPYQASSNLRVYKGPLPKFPGTTASPWVALHSPVKIYLPIRNTGEKSPESEDCVQCPRNLIIQLPPHQKYISMPVPTISLCSSFAQLSGRVHVAVISGPRPGQRLVIGRHEVQLMVWKAMGPVHSCNYVILVRGKNHGSAPTRYHVQNVPCPKPEEPSNGMLLCVPNGVKYYPHNSVCQFFCLDNYLLKNSNTNSSTIVCNNGKWSPQDHIFCVAAFCPRPPRPPAHGSWICHMDDSETRFSNGTLCKVSCAPDFVVGTSQIGNSEIVCLPPTWNGTKIIPECKRAHLPKLQHCHNRHIIINTGTTVKISDQLLPKGISHENVALFPVCSLQRKNLSKGKHQNMCEVIDQELRTSRKCSYIIHIEESSGPQPQKQDCKNRTVYANRKGTIRSKPVRFIIQTGNPNRTQVLRGNCTPRGDLRVGSHFIVCKAVNPHTGSTNTCSYWLNVKERTCSPLRSIPNGQTVCVSRTSGSICHYECNPGYYFPDNELIRSVKTCYSNLKWHPAADPVCKIIPPELEEGCDNMEINMSSPINFTVPEPKFLTFLNETLYASCTPATIFDAGHHQVRCTTKDFVYNASCHFNVSILCQDQMTMLPTEEQSSFLIEGCEDVEVNGTLSANFTIPLPKYLSSYNETIEALCSPNVITSSGIHQVKCTVYDIFNTSCIFNVTVHPSQEETTLIPTEIEQSPLLIEGCEDVEANETSSANFTIPLPKYLSYYNETIEALCSPNVITVSGIHQIKCTVYDIFNTSCIFNVTVHPSQEETTLIPTEIEQLPLLIEGCEDVEVNETSSANFTIPLPKYLSSYNETIEALCSPNVITSSGIHQVKCTVYDIFNTSCIFNVTVHPSQEETTLIPTEIEELPKLVYGCYELNVNLTSPINFTIPVPQYVTSRNETLVSSCEPPYITETGLFLVKCSIDNITFDEMCYFNVTIELENEQETTSSPKEDETPDTLEDCNNLEMNVSSPFILPISLPQLLSSQNASLPAICEPPLITTSGEHHIKCLVDNSTFSETCHFNVTIRFEDETTPSTYLEKAKPPELLEGCNNLEVNVSSTFNFSIPLPQFLVSENKSVVATCEPLFITTIGQHYVNCSVESLTFKQLCSFNVTIQLEDDTIPLNSLSKEFPELLEGCNDLEVNLFSPINFSVPLPLFLSSENETITAACEPPFLTETGQHQVKCSVDDLTSAFSESCYFNVTIDLEDEIIPLISPGTELPELVEGCRDLEVNLSSPINFSVPLPLFFSSWNETLAVSCEPSSITAAGEHEVNCTIDSLRPIKSCYFKVLVQLEDNLVTSPLPDKADAPKLVKGCYDLEVNVAPPFNFTIPLPRYLTSQNETLYAVCQPSFVTVVGNYRVNCSVNDASSTENTFCQFNATVMLDEPSTPSSTETDFCKPFSPPSDGSMQCSSRGQIETCLVTCNPGFGFSDDYSFTAVCDRNLDGLWNFQRSDAGGTLPECFAQVEGSAVELWISFEAFAPHCETELQEQMKSIIDDMCQLDADCSNFDINCTLDEESDMMLVTANWTVQADFNNEEYLDHEDIPEAETRLENVLERVRAYLATEDGPEDVHLFRDSFRRGHMTLVCPNGFAPDLMMANCVQCPMENSHCK